MKTIELRLEPDRETPVFQRLRYEWSEASLREVLLMGIHPWGGPHAHRSLLQAFTQRLNRPEQKPNDLESHGFCWDLHSSPSYSRYGRSTPPGPKVRPHSGYTGMLVPVPSLAGIVARG